MNIISKQVVKTLIKSKPSRDTSLKIINFALKNEYFRETLIEASIEATYTYKDGVMTDLFNRFKGSQIRKLFSNEAYREQAVDCLNWALQYDSVRNALLRALDDM